MREISFYIKSVKRYGIRGVIDYFKRLPCDIKTKRQLTRSIIHTPPISGITLLAPFLQPTSLSKVMRDFAFKLKEANIPYQTCNTSQEECQIPSEDYSGILTNASDFSFNRYTCTIDMFKSNSIHISRPGIRHAHVAFWKFDDGFKDIHFGTFDGSDIIVFSDFCAKVFRNEAPKGTRIHKIRYPFRFEMRDISSREEMRERYNLNKDDFVVFFNFHYASSYYRKNPDAIVKAFASAFKDKDDVKLVFKTMGAKAHPDKVNNLLQLARDLSIYDKLITIDNYISQQDIYGLTNACDVYISLHRGEGFGLGVAEAMSLGRPVIVTDYSSTTEFCNKENSIPIPYKMIPFDHTQNDIAAYNFVTSCADPDIDAAAQALRRCYDDRVYAKDLGKKGQDFIKDYFSIENFRKSVFEFLCSKPRTVSYNYNKLRKW